MPLRRPVDRQRAELVELERAITLTFDQMLDPGCVPLAGDGYRPVMFDFRTAHPDDHGWMSRVVDDWWGRPIVASLPRLFLDHFWSTSTVVEDDGRPIAFLVGFLSPSEPGNAYIHFVGVDPEHRGAGLGRELYERFFAMARERGATEVSAVTSPINTGSIAFHRTMGFDVSDPIDSYDRPGTALVHFHRTL